MLHVQWAARQPTRNCQIILSIFNYINNNQHAIMFKFNCEILTHWGRLMRCSLYQNGHPSIDWPRLAKLYLCNDTFSQVCLVSKVINIELSMNNLSYRFVFKSIMEIFFASLLQWSIGHPSTDLPRQAKSDLKSTNASLVTKPAMSCIKSTTNDI